MLCVMYYLRVGVVCDAYLESKFVHNSYNTILPTVLCISYIGIV